MRVLFDNNVPVGIRGFLRQHDVRTVLQMKWDPQLENGELLKAAETEGFHVLVTSDQNIRYQQNLSRRKISLVVLESNIWPVVRTHGKAISEAVDDAKPGSYRSIPMPLPARPRKRRNP